MILSDKTIRAKIKSGEIVIEPFSDEFLQPATYDLHLDNFFLTFNKESIGIVDVKEKPKNLMREIEVGEKEGFIIHPNEFVLANVREITGVDSKHVGRLEGKSSLGRLGLIVHATAGFLDPGNKLRLTLELANVSPIPIKIYPGMKIAQIAFETLDKDCERPYGSKGLNSKYLGDLRVKGSEIWRNFK
ncbi:MAG: deoxycytidine triphosphate deaminase [candidate division WS6 bacterium 36_33]|uniref:dCTP deaminase, dUMP-forming n=1 Tax=candidate division WS6 bacterium 36_33 TaxID=1641388 RepID=A0A101GZ76_9BACT|nr:MAG: deoxycytidine triphosphate deaminase [candidate division WS6 bacterium 36_33]